MSDEALPEADRAEGAPHPRETFALIGQDAAEQQVLDALAEKRLHHAWMLTGPQGIGKATLAWRMARHLLATPVDDGGGLFGDAPAVGDTLEIAPDHPVSRRTIAMSEPRLFLLRRTYDEKAKRLRAEIVVDDVRRLKSFFALSAAEGGRRVAIVDAADEMNVNAANALLKILEEPPKDAVLILVSHRPARLLPTIRSRCRVIRMGRLSPEDVAAVLEGSGVAPSRPERLAVLADGSAGEALRLEMLEGVTLYSEIVALMDTLPRLDRSRALALVEPLAARGQEERLRLFVRLFETFLARLARHGAGQESTGDAAEDERAVFARLAPTPRAARDWADLQQALVGRAGHALAVNLDPAQVLMDMLLKTDATAARLLATA